MRQYRRKGIKIIKKKQRNYFIYWADVDFSVKIKIIHEKIYTLPLCHSFIQHTYNGYQSYLTSIRLWVSFYLCSAQLLLFDRCFGRIKRQLRKNAKADKSSKCKIKKIAKNVLDELLLCIYLNSECWIPVVFLLKDSLFSNDVSQQFANKLCLINSPMCTLGM